MIWLIVVALLIVVGLRTYYRVRINQQRRAAGLPKRDWSDG